MGAKSIASRTMWYILYILIATVAMWSKDMWSLCIVGHGVSGCGILIATILYIL